RTQEVTRQVIRHRFLDPDATAEVIAQKIRQTGLKISTRSGERVIEKFGLQKKTSSLSFAPSDTCWNTSHQEAAQPRTLCPPEPRTRCATAPRRQGQWHY